MKIKITTDGYKCNKCAHEWKQKSKHSAKPRLCPKCKTVKWDD